MPPPLGLQQPQLLPGALKGGLQQLPVGAEKASGIFQNFAAELLLFPAAEPEYTPGAAVLLCPFHQSIPVDGGSFLFQQQKAASGKGSGSQLQPHQQLPGGRGDPGEENPGQKPYG